MNEMFVNLRELDEAITQATTSEQIAIILDALKTYENEISDTWLFEKNSRFYFNLRNAVAGIKRDAQAKLGALVSTKP